MKVDNLQTYLDYLYDMDYAERPVSFETFVCDERYLGIATKKGTVVYPVWKKKLAEFLGDDSKYLGAFTGSIGCGKTRGSVWGSLYVMYRILCVAWNSSVYDAERQKWVTIASAYKNKMKWTLSLDETGRVAPCKIDTIIYSGIKPVYKVKIKYAENKFIRNKNFKYKTVGYTPGGRYKTLEATAEHKIWTDSGWKSISELCIGEKVLVYAKDLKTKEELHRIVSESTKKVWASRTKEERAAICMPGINKMNSSECVAKANCTKKTVEFSNRCSNSIKEFYARLTPEERLLATEHLRTEQCKKNISIGVKRSWDKLSVEERARRGQLSRNGVDFDAWRKTMISKVWNNPNRNSKLSASAARQAANDTTRFSSRMYGARTIAKDGHVCDSKFECLVDDWLFEHGILHDVHVIIQQGAKSRNVDFYANGWYIEVDGLNRSDEYFKNKLNGFPFIVIRYKDDLEEKLGFIKDVTNSNFEKELFGDVVSIEFVGEKSCYDIVMDDSSPKNYVCSGVVVHNCLKDAWAYFSLAPLGKMAIVFFNLTKSLSASKSYQLIQQHLISSPWFANKGIIRGKGSEQWLDIPLFEYVLASPGSRGFCFSGDTKISLLDGRELSIIDIMHELSLGKELWVYSCDTENRRIVPGRITSAFKTKSKATTIRIKLDNGEDIVCTPDHPFMLLDGTYKLAKDLLVTDSLMPLYRQVNDRGYEQFLDVRYNVWRYTHRRTAGDIPKEYRDLHGRFSKSIVVHHTDFNKRNNNPTNLVYMTREEHTEYHANNCEKTWHSPEARNKAKQTKLSRMTNPVYANKLSENISDGVRRYWDSNTKDVIRHREVLRKLFPETYKKIMADPVLYNKIYNTESNKKRGISYKKFLTTEAGKQYLVDKGEIFRTLNRSKEFIERINKSEKLKAARSKNITKYNKSEERINKLKANGTFAKAGKAGMKSLWDRLNSNPKEKAIFILNRNIKLRKATAFISKLCGCGCEEYFRYRIGSTQRFITYHSNKGNFNPRSKNRKKINHKIVSIQSNVEVDVYDITVDEYHNFALSAGVFVHNSTQGKDILIAIMDEVDSPDASEKMKQKVLAAYESTVIRFVSRFVKDGETIAKFFLVASKQDQLSFLNVFIEKMKSSGSLFVVDIPIWEAKPCSDYCGKKFFVMVGDVYTNPRILETQEDIKKAMLDGFEIIEVPVEYKKNFEDDIVGSLKDLAGRTAGGARKNRLFVSEQLIKACYDPNKQEPIKKLTIELGLQDKVDLINFIDFTKIRTARNIPRFIHHDISYSGNGDASGLACSAIVGYKKVNTMLPDGRFEETPLPVVETDWIMRIKGRPGDNIPLFTIRKLVLDLRLIGFNIYQYSADLSLLSEETNQLLTLSGINCKYISLDKDVSRYLLFRDLVNQGRWIYHQNDYVHFELKNLLRDERTNKVDHPDTVPELVPMQDGSVKTLVMVGSKDLSDAGAGSVSEALSSAVQTPNVEVIRSAINILQQVQEQASSPVDSLLSIQHMKDKKEEAELIQNKQSAKFIDILKRANN